ncbi:uncharacterized protein LOC119393585 isoform X2 [Rhipicephalus sanguineus]|uniref:uncharacterized protein LOC119393585 isoform X2 n=1 Tax=Rhipicephalus sanguineus TaxID=34632 RepID=UPI0018950013|nr:uncharacterized protein LOC119393585 isoform X2 [Rhipicephalus sanguineus]
MKESSLSLLFFYVFYCGLGNEHCDAARISKRSDEPMQSVLDLFNVTESGKKDAFQSTVRPRIVTDVNLGGHHLAEIFEDTNSSEIVSCNLIGSKELIENILESIPSENVTNLSIEEMDQFIDKCEDRDTSQEGSSLLDSLGDAFHSLVIFPGTKWCGPGDVAKNYDDLGKASDTDRCCREHDHSEDNIPAFGTKHNITNYLPYTIWRLLLLDNPCVDEEPDTSKPKEWHIESPPNFLETYIEKKRDEKRKESSESEENEV